MQLLHFRWPGCHLDLGFSMYYLTNTNSWWWSKYLHLIIKKVLCRVTSLVSFWIIWIYSQKWWILSVTLHSAFLTVHGRKTVRTDSIVWCGILSWKLRKMPWRLIVEWWLKHSTEYILSQHFFLHIFYISEMGIFLKICGILLSLSARPSCHLLSVHSTQLLFLLMFQSTNHSKVT